MKKKVKKITSIALMVMLLVSMVCVPVYGVGGEDGNVISQGSAVLKGTFLFNCETGAVGSSGDIFWEQVDNTVRKMVPQGQATIVNLGIVDFNSVKYPVLKSYTYGSTPIVGNNDSTNQLVKNDVFAVKTNLGHYTKILVTSYNYNLSIKWVTYEEPMAAPIQVSPANGQVLYHFPRTTTLSWTPVKGAVSYKVERQYFDSSKWVDYPAMKIMGESNTSYTFNFIGDQKGRWRVTAYTNKSSSLTSDWWEFSYSTGIQLPTPVLVTPADNIVFSNFPRMTTLTWKPVPGASKYLVEWQYASGGTWSAATSATVVGSANASYTFKFIGAQSGRWRVTALGTAPYINSSPSDWLNFSYKI